MAEGGNNRITGEGWEIGKGFTRHQRFWLTFWVVVGAVVAWVALLILIGKVILAYLGAGETNE